MRRAPILLLLPLLLAVACRTADPSLKSASGEDLADLDPLPYRLAIAPVHGMATDGFQTEAPIHFTADNAGLQDMLVAVLDSDREHAKDLKIHSQRAVNEAVMIPRGERGTIAESIIAARAKGADLLLVPRIVEDPSFAYGKITGRWPTTTLLWITTWIGGHFVQDRQYRAAMSIEFELLNPYDGTSITTFTAISRTMDATLWERCNRRFFTAQTAISLLIPQYWVPDSKTLVSRDLTARVSERLGAQFTGYMKEKFARTARNLTGTINRVSPANGAVIHGEKFDFRAEVVAERPITEIAVFRPNGELLVEWIADAGDKSALGADFSDRRFVLPSTEKQADGASFRVPIDVPDIAVKGMDTWVRVEFAVLGRFASQTFRYRAATEK